MTESAVLPRKFTQDFTILHTSFLSCIWKIFYSWITETAKMENWYLL